MIFPVAMISTREAQNFNLLSDRAALARLDLAFNSIADMQKLHARITDVNEEIRFCAVVATRETESAHRIPSLDRGLDRHISTLLVSNSLDKALLDVEILFQFRQLRGIGFDQHVTAKLSHPAFVLRVHPPLI